MILAIIIPWGVVMLTWQRSVHYIMMRILENRNLMTTLLFIRNVMLVKRNPRALNTPSLDSRSDALIAFTYFLWFLSGVPTMFFLEQYIFLRYFPLRHVKVRTFWAGGAFWGVCLGPLSYVRSKVFRNRTAVWSSSSRTQ